MNRRAVACLALGIGISLSAPMVEANVIRNACLKADRQAADRALCGCIQTAADQTLTRRDQKLASSFFEDPHKAQEIRQSDRRSHEKFWKRYKVFRDQAEAICQ